MATTPLPRTDTSIVDNQGDNTLNNALAIITENGQELWIATAFFSLEALNLLGEHLNNCTNIRLLFGSDASGRQRNALLQATRELSDKDLVKARAADPLLEGLKHAQRLIQEGRLEARVYTEQKFHAKAYLSHRTGYPPVIGMLGSSNFTRQGLTENIELNVELTKEQTASVREWYEKRWEEAKQDEVTEFLKAEIQRQIKLYEPHAIYLKSLLAWGDHIQGRASLPPSAVLDRLDPHQEDAYRQALKIIGREKGVMICDGVGLGKSYVALALMEEFLRQGKQVLLVAPAAIIDASWHLYLKQFLSRYSRKFGNLVTVPITWFGFEPQLSEEERRKLADKGETAPEPPEKLKEKYEDLDGIAEQADVIVIDESHNYRKTGSQRYVNTLRALKANVVGHKTVILLTATPLNTEYQDVTAQFRLISQDSGTIGGLPIAMLQKEAATMDAEDRKDPETHPVLPLFDDADSIQLIRALQSVAIQRSRKTCKELARSRGKELRFPDREDPSHIDYELSPSYARLVKKTYDDFHELADFLAAYRAEVKRAAATPEKQLRNRALKMPTEGLRLSAYLPDRYRKSGMESLRDAQVESFLALLVFTNVLKQLESSSAAFQGILQAIGAGLCARLHHVFGEEVNAVLSEHSGWINRNLRHIDADEEAFEDAVTIVGDEDEPWLEQAKRSRSIQQGLKDFGPETHDVKAWRAHIESDLRKLRDIHEYTVLTRTAAEDRKLIRVAEAAKKQLALGRKVLIFTQSVRTSQYLYDQLPALLGTKVERIDASVTGDRRHRLLHDFSPKYNPMENPPLAFEEFRVLVSTDVLSEGVNLQEAGCILNYDLHWNPVRLIQRIGRVDRRLREDDPVHKFSILNVVPPKEIEDIINLVGTVEGRKRKISRLLGLDQSFFSAKDEAGTLKEFNAMVEGETTPRDRVLEAYTQQIHLSPEEIAKAENVPPGGLGVWKNAPAPGLFALFRIAAKEAATPETQEAFANIIGRPILAMKLETPRQTPQPLLATNGEGQSDPSVAPEPVEPTRPLPLPSVGEVGEPANRERGLRDYLDSGPKCSAVPAVANRSRVDPTTKAKELFDAPTILQILSQTTPAEPSGHPSNAEFLARELAALKKSARQNLRDLKLTTGIELRLECWMELMPE